MSNRRWFHPNISGYEAEQLLLEKGQDGSFLCRPSKSNRGDFTLSVRRGDSVTHVKIQKDGDFFDLYGGEVFTSISELVQYYMEHELKEKNGEIIHLKHPMKSEDPTSERWYHGLISGQEAERLLLDRGKNGFFLVRESVSSPGDYVLSIRNDDNIVHIMIRNIDGYYDAGGGPAFPDLSELIDNYKKNPMVEKSGGTVVHLKAPFNATRVTASKIADRVKELLKENAVIAGKNGFWEEFEQLQRQEEYRHMYTRGEGQKQENKSKNRYKYILPFDHTRVMLKDVDSDISGSDYINANYIDGEEGVRYIATQGCLPNTIDDFWRMVFFENARIILNVTREIERGRTKCSKYWPNAGDMLDTENFTIKNTNEKETPEYILREFEVIYKTMPDGSSIRVSQYHYTGWPEHGVPPDPGSVLEVLHDVCLCNKNENNPGPIVVHCSAGIGRTGTFIVIHILLGILQKHGLDSEIDIPKTIQLVRSQRSGMVQTETQYKFIYLALEHYVETEKKRQGITMQRPLDFGVGPPSPLHTSIAKRSHPASANEFTFSNDINHRQFSSSEAPPPIPERRPRNSPINMNQELFSAPSIEKQMMKFEKAVPPPPPIPSKDVPPPIPPRA